jgi:uncharacterized protein YcaQ
MATGRVVRLAREEARGLMLAAQGLFDPPAAAPTLDDLRTMVTRLGVVQVDTINVVRRSQYLVLWSRLGPYDDAWLDALLSPHRATFEYWSHAASIVPMEDYRFYRLDMLNYATNLYPSDHTWLQSKPQVLRETLATIRKNGPMASSDFERPDDGRRAEAWDWFGLKESRRALHVLWTTGELMVHSRRGGQKVYDLRERVLAEAFGRVPSDKRLPEPAEQQRHFVRRTVAALGVVTPSWLWDYFRQALLEGQLRNKRAAATELLDELVAKRVLVRAEVEGLDEPAYISRERLADLERMRGGVLPTRTTLLSPFDSLIWHRARARSLFDYEVCLETYVVPEKRRYGYYCLAILHRGWLVGRLDPKYDRDEGVLRVRALHLEPGVTADETLLDDLAGSLRELARFLGAQTITIERAEAPGVVEALRERVGTPLYATPTQVLS